jgi:hypothetical protein
MQRTRLATDVGGNAANSATSGGGATVGARIYMPPTWIVWRKGAGAT